MRQPAQLKNEKELQRKLRDALIKNNFYAIKIESPFVKGLSDLYVARKGNAGWIEVKFFKELSENASIKEKIRKAPTLLQKVFLEAQVKHGIHAFVVAGYYVEEDGWLKLRYGYQYYNKETYFQVGLSEVELIDHLRDLMR